MECCRRNECGYEIPSRVTTDVVARVGGALQAWDRTAPTHELELRLLDVTPAFFSRATTMVHAFDGWDQRADETITDITHSGGVRTRRSSRSGVHHVRKSRCAHVDIPVHPGPQEGRDFPTSVRLALAVEDPVALATTDVAVVDVEAVRRQHRRSFWLRGVRLDLSTVHMGATYPLMENSVPTHEIEWEVEDAAGLSLIHI